MSHDTPSSTTPVDWRTVHAWGLPAGSIRGLLAILIFGTVWALLLLQPGDEIPDYLRDLLFIIMGHYFAARHRARRPRSRALLPCSCREGACDSS